MDGIFNDIMNRFNLKIGGIKSKQITQINCEIFIGSITGTLKNCNIEIVNNCLSGDNLELLLESIFETIILSDKDTQKIILDDMGIDINLDNLDIKKLLDKSKNTKFIKDCKAVATANNLLSIQYLNLGYCISNIPITFKIINSGSASANCGIEKIFSSLMKVNNPVDTSEIDIVGVFGYNLDYLNNFIIILGCIFIMFIFLFIIIPNVGEIRLFFRNII